MLNSRFSEVQPPNGLCSGLQALVETGPTFSSVNPIQAPSVHPWQSACHEGQHDIYSLQPVTFHANPLAPLRQKDEQALVEIFDDFQIEDILADVCIRLKQIYPEPCWEDEPFNFLEGYL